MIKKIIIGLVAVVVIVIFLNYFFTPKEKTYCNATIPPEICTKYKCNRGIIYSVGYIGGYKAKCLGGEIIKE